MIRELIKKRKKKSSEDYSGKKKSKTPKKYSVLTGIRQTLTEKNGAREFQSTGEKFF